MEHPIEGLMKTAMQSIQDMVDVNTIIGEPIETTNGMVIIPISKVNFGFAAGGSEFSGETIDEYKRKDKEEEVQYRLPFGGGSGAGVSINPVAFVIVCQDSIKVMPIEHTSAIDKLMDYVPDLMQKATSVINKVSYTKKDNIEKENEELENDLKKQTLNKVVSRKGKKQENTKIEIDYDEDGKNEQYLEDE